jgi:arylsulfatase A-like enzyme
MLPHRQYVLPFAPMNTLLSLLEGNSYRIMASLDPIVSVLMPRSPQRIELGADSVRSRDDACRVLSEISRDLDQSRSDAPAFAYSLAMNTHISYAQGQPILGESHPGFNAPLAARVRQIDACVGTFVEYLKGRDLYDNSVIVVTSDHGDAVGEGGRWGHGSAGFPEIFRIPLLVHLPPRLAARWTADVDAVSFSTDIVPTFYRLLDQELVLSGSMFGMPLVYPLDGAAPRQRRRGSFLLAGSYGPVDALLQRNGDLLYVVDALNARDYAFDLTGGAPHATSVPVTPGERAGYQRVIAEQVDAIAAFFGFDAQPSR